jgi:hypothetical protein
VNGLPYWHGWQQLRLARAKPHRSSRAPTGDPGRQNPAAQPCRATGFERRLSFEPSWRRLKQRVMRAGPRGRDRQRNGAEDFVVSTSTRSSCAQPRRNFDL